MPQRGAAVSIGLAAIALAAGCATVPTPAVPAAVAPPPVSAPAVAPAPAPVAAPPPPVPDGTVLVRIDTAKAYQVIEGFGATITEHFDLATREDLMGALRPRVIEALFGQIKVSLGQLDVGPYENFDPSRYLTANDNDDPSTINWAGFNFVRSDSQKKGIVDPARPYGFDNFTIHSGTNVRWSDPWMAEIRRKDYQRYLEEMAENVVAPLIYWRDKLGIVPKRWHHLFNEPTTGNVELASTNVQEVVDIVKAVGARFKREGFGHLKLVVASEETEERSLATARAILADPDARQYVGAISYHTYPYGSVYSDVGNILATSGQGWPDERRLHVRGSLGYLAFEYGLQVWMTEVSHGKATSFDAMRGRAIHIHDELRYANASAYWAMFSAWNTQARRGTCDEDCLVHFDRQRGTVRISQTGHAMGHYARWVRPGAVSVGVQTGDRLVLASAFRDDARQNVVVVLINNRPDPVPVIVSVSGKVSPAGTPKGEQSSAEGYWLPLTLEPLRADGSFAATLPPRSVTSLAVDTR